MAAGPTKVGQSVRDDWARQTGLIGGALSRLELPRAGSSGRQARKQAVSQVESVQSPTHPNEADDEQTVREEGLSETCPEGFNSL